MSNNIQQLKIPALQSKLISIAKQKKEDMAPYLFYLRPLMNKQGKAGQGFGPWVEKHLDISRRTADRWANEYGIGKGLMTKKPKRTSGHVSKGGNLDQSDGPGMVWCNLALLLTQSQEEELLSAWETLGKEDATQLICDTLKQAAKAKAEKEASPDPFPVESGELQDIGPVSTKRPVQTVEAGSSRVTLAGGDSSNAAHN